MTANVISIERRRELRNRQHRVRDVRSAYQTLRSSMQNILHSETLLSMARRSHDAVEHRYRMGGWSILELLNAQLALAGAKWQRIHSLADWRSALLQLAAKLGKIGMWRLGSSDAAAAI